MNLLSILSEDHRRLRKLFRAYAGEGGSRSAIIARALSELRTHTRVENEVFYPALGLVAGEDTSPEGLRERELVQVLAADHAESLGSIPDMRWAARSEAAFAGLIAAVEAHLEREEALLFPLAERLDRATLEVLARRIAALRGDDGAT